jgi:hypothetical protein
VLADDIYYPHTGKQRKNRQKTLRGTAKVKGAKSKKEK